MIEIYRLREFSGLKLMP